MAGFIKKYTIGKSRLKQSLKHGFTVSDDGVLLADENAGIHTLFMKKVDSAIQCCPWGRLSFCCEMSDESILTVSAFASDMPDFIIHQQLRNVDDFLLDESVNLQRKENFLALVKASKFVNQQDMLLYEQTGRYLWISIQAAGTGTVRLWDINLYAPGDSFYQTFPEIYKNDGEFLHRYLSIFSTLYTDLQLKVDDLHQYLDIDTTPANMLPVLAKWMGLEIDGDFLHTKQLRMLLKNAFLFINGKGTKRILKNLIEILTDSEFYIIEQGYIISRGMLISENSIQQGTQNKNILTVLINCKRDEKLHGNLMVLMNQFMPYRCILSIIFLDNSSALDAHSYLDINAKLVVSSPACLNQENRIGQILLLQ